MTNTPLDPWVRVVTGQVAHPWQRRHIDRSLQRRYRMWLGARQDVGKTWSQAVLAVMLAAGVRMPGLTIPGHDVYLCSADQQRSMDMIRRVQEHLDAAAIAYDCRDPKLGSTTRVALRGGSHIRAITSDPTNLQGLTGSVLIDELSRADQPDELIAQAMSVARSRSYYRVIATTNASAGEDWLATWWQAEHMATRRAPWDLDTTTVYDVHGVDLPADLINVREALTPEHWQRYYECRFVGADSPILPMHLRDRCADDAPPWSIGAARRWVSVDVGAGGDATAIMHLSAWPGGRVQIEEVVLLWDRDTHAQAQLIGAYADSVGASVIDIDAGGVGRGIADSLRASGRPVRACAVSDISRAKGAGVLVALAERGLITWGRCGGDVAELRRDIGHADAERTPDGAINRVSLPRRRDERGRQTHCDALDALLMTLATQPVSTGGSVYVGQARPRRRI